MSMIWRDMPQEVQEAHLRIQEAIEKEIHLLGPTSEWGRSQIENSDDEPKADTMLSEWVLICAEVEMDTGDVWRSLYHSPRLPRHHVHGLLRTYTD